MKKILPLIITIFLVSACTDGIDVKPVDNRTKAQKQTDEHGSLFGLGNALGGKKTDLKDNNIKINAYLWRASLDTLSVHPLEKIVTESGILQTEWVSMNNIATEQTKISVIVISADLNVTGVRVNVYKRKKQNGNWVNQSVSKNTAKAISDAILQRARELYQEDNTN